MAVQTIRPNGDGGVNQWSFCSHNPHYLGINEVVLDLAGHITGSEPNGDNNDVEEFTFTTFDGIEDNSITQVVVKTEVYHIGARRLEVAISWDNGASWSGAVNMTTGSGMSTNTFAGLSYSKADLDKFELKYIADCGTKGDLGKVYQSYVIVTYTEAAVGYGHDYMGVPAANIGSVNGVPTANIANIKGV